MICNKFLVFGIALTLAAPAPKDAPKKAAPSPIIGDWVCVDLVAGGRMITPAEMNQVGPMGNEFTADGKHRGRFGAETTEGTFTTDPSKDPAELNCVSAKNGRSAAGIYRVEKDTLTLCFTEGGVVRPTKFESPAGTRIMLMTFRRVVKKE